MTNRIKYINENGKEEILEKINDTSGASIYVRSSDLCEKKSSEIQRVESDTKLKDLNVFGGDSL